jgi:hypothetical protein
VISEFDGRIGLNLGLSADIRSNHGDRETNIVWKRENKSGNLCGIIVRIIREISIEENQNVRVERTADFLSVLRCERVPREKILIKAFFNLPA